MTNTEGRAKFMVLLDQMVGPEGAPVRELTEEEARAAGVAALGLGFGLLHGVGDPGEDVDKVVAFLRSSEQARRAAVDVDGPASPAETSS